MIELSFWYWLLVSVIFVISLILISTIVLIVYNLLSELFSLIMRKINLKRTGEGQ